MGSLRARAWPCRSQSGGCAEDSVGFGFGFGFVGVASSIPFCSSIPATSRGHGAGSVGVFHRYATATEFATCARPTRTLALPALATRWLANGSGSMGSLRARAWPCRSQSGGAPKTVGSGSGSASASACSELRSSLRGRPSSRCPDGTARPGTAPGPISGDGQGACRTQTPSILRHPGTPSRPATWVHSCSKARAGALSGANAVTGIRRGPICSTCVA